MFQDSLFDAPRVWQRPATIPVGELCDRVGLESLAFLYTSSDSGNSSGVRFAATIDDARLWCSSPVSAGTLHGARWAYFWTTAWNYLMFHNGQGGYHGDAMRLQIDLAGATDSGEWDDRIAASGCLKIHLDELPDILRPMGVEVIR